MDRTELTLGAQTRAAGMVGDSLEPLHESLRRLAAELEAHEDGFRGGAAHGFGAAASAWFGVARELLPTLRTLQDGLARTDRTTGRVDRREATSFGHIGDVLSNRLAYGSGADR